MIKEKNKQIIPSTVQFFIDVFSHIVLLIITLLLFMQNVLMQMGSYENIAKQANEILYVNKWVAELEKLPVKFLDDLNEIWSLKFENCQVFRLFAVLNKMQNNHRDGLFHPPKSVFGESISQFKKYFFLHFHI